MDNINRIKEMENILDNTHQKIQDVINSLEALKAYQEEIEKLEAYYTSSYWKEDFQLDEEGKLPADLKHGVLSEDGISSVLDDYHELMTFL
ncbi:DUF4298 domain-containing protein [Kandleria vitulina]|uniref:DUF4298 domain-containing protein n=1 Tax=Kandleria vitulina TaxID=1630 RepID=UPI00048ECFEC|nr:DUF4298 domain-containing protein [Kandleria vitulina]